MGHRMASLSYRARQEMLAQVAPRYRKAALAQKMMLLDHLLATQAEPWPDAVILGSSSSPLPELSKMPEDPPQADVQPVAYPHPTLALSSKEQEEWSSIK
jgi:hypothetical protein